MVCPIPYGLEQRVVKAKFHYARWFEAGSKLVVDRFEAKFHYAMWFEPASNQLRTSSEPARVMEFGFNSLYADIGDRLLSQTR